MRCCDEIALSKEEVAACREGSEEAVSTRKGDCRHVWADEQIQRFCLEVGSTCRDKFYERFTRYTNKKEHNRPDCELCAGNTICNEKAPGEIPDAFWSPLTKCKGAAYFPEQIREVRSLEDANVKLVSEDFCFEQQTMCLQNMRGGRRADFVRSLFPNALVPSCKAEKRGPPSALSLTNSPGFEQ